MRISPLQSQTFVLQNSWFLLGSTKAKLQERETWDQSSANIANILMLLTVPPLTSAEVSCACREVRTPRWPYSELLNSPVKDSWWKHSVLAPHSLSPPPFFRFRSLLSLKYELTKTFFKKPTRCILIHKTENIHTTTTYRMENTLTLEFCAKHNTRVLLNQ